MMNFWAFCVIFLYCEFGSNVSGRFEEINEPIYGCDWYSFPVEEQKMLPFILLASQERVVIKGFGNFAFARDAFKKVFVDSLKFYSFCYKIRL